MGGGGGGGGRERALVCPFRRSTLVLLFSFLQKSSEDGKKANAAALVKKRAHLQKNTMASGSDLPRVLEVSRLVAAREPEVRLRE